MLDESRGIPEGRDRLLDSTIQCRNSSGAVAVLAAQLPVLCFGRAIYRQPDSVYCPSDDGAALMRVTEELPAGHCRLFRE